MHVRTTRAGVECDLCHITLNKNAGKARCCSKKGGLGRSVCCLGSGVDVCHTTNLLLQCSVVCRTAFTVLANAPIHPCHPIFLMRSCGRRVGADPRRRAHRLPRHDLPRPEGGGCVLAASYPTLLASCAALVLTVTLDGVWVG